MTLPPGYHGKWHFRGPQNKHFLRKYVPGPCQRLKPSALGSPSCAYLNGKATLRHCTAVENLNKEVARTQITSPADEGTLKKLNIHWSRIETRHC